MNLKEKIYDLIKQEKSFEYYLEKFNSYSEQKMMFSPLLESFVHINFSEEEAQTHWKNVIIHHEHMSQVLKRNVGLKVPMLDYFQNLNQILLNPLIVEMHVFSEAKKMALIDGLTGAYNRRYFDEAFKKELERSKRHNNEFSILIMDLDDFKKVNDSKGHPFGDETLKNFSRVCKEMTREEDVFCRYGGEEFCYLLPETSGNGALVFGERLRDSIKKDPFLKKIPITFSGGISTFPHDGRSFKKLLNSGDESLYQAKFEGKDLIIKSSLKKRRFRRYHVTWEMSYSILTEDGFSQETEETVTQDISLGGVRFESRMKIDILTQVKIKLHLKDNQKVHIETNGYLSWVREVNASTFEYGVKFHHLDDPSKKILKDHLARKK